MTKAQQQRDWKIRREWKEIYRLGDKLAKTQKAKDAILRKLMESVREVHAREVHAMETTKRFGNR